MTYRMTIDSCNGGFTCFCHSIPARQELFVVRLREREVLHLLDVSPSWKDINSLEPDDAWITYAAENTCIMSAIFLRLQYVNYILYGIMPTRSNLANKSTLVSKCQIFFLLSITEASH